MNPTAVLERLLKAVDEDNYHDAVDALNTYYQWRLKGGYEPKLPFLAKGRMDGDEFANQAGQQLATNLLGTMP